VHHSRAEGVPALRYLQGWAAMLPAQLLSVLHYPLWMPSSHPPFAKYAKNVAPAAWWLLQFEAGPPANVKCGFCDP